MSVYGDIIQAQTKQGFLGGKNGALSNLTKPVKQKYTRPVEFTISKGTVVEGLNLDENGLADPFIKIGRKTSKGGIKWLVTSPVCNKTLNPEWNYVVRVECTLSKLNTLIVEMHDKDFLSKDFIGTCTIYCNTLTSYDMKMKTYEMFDRENTKKTGSIDISITKPL